MSQLLRFFNVGFFAAPRSPIPRGSWKARASSCAIWNWDPARAPAG